ncbi:LysM peptidoglycan-binding domain-containing protein [Terrihabitans rhizophilus]|uniref:LysM peptidoglycan-binding domain-containing protein n=1 Tax=Terrihabitans rhizophilus TaxID=3092662 RepID=A0ABU4RP62_9HYPH|nr:LysM peptidoglycan-binding domain-containing protein [Terrihabitans sp. PJ23]MDX6806631.1 LysM peptidoglycan-binding domain-containing protein [Terrihabitans sp. PJ23]
MAAAPTDQPPSFDIARVEPDGSALIAGRTSPGREVELLANGTVLDRTKANEAGDFVISPPSLPPGNHELLLRSGGQTSAKSVMVSVPQPGGKDVLVVAGEPGRPLDVIQAGPKPSSDEAEAKVYQPASGTAATPSLPLKIAAVEAEAGQLFVQGTGPAGEKAQIYLNNQAVAGARIGADGKWSLTVREGIPAGDYSVRVDQIGQEGSVSARAEVPFSVGTQEAAAVPASSQAKPSLSGGEPSAPLQDALLAQAGADANPVIAQLSTLQVQRGDNLWKIARQTYGRGIRYSTIYEANSQQIRNPRLIYPGQVFVMPPDQAQGG